MTLNYLIIVFDEEMRLLTNPFKLLNANTEPMHLLQNFCQLFAFIEKHVLDLFLKDFLPQNRNIYVFSKLTIVCI